MPSREPTALGSLPGHLIRRAQQLHVSLWKDHGPGDMTSPQFAVLHALFDHPKVDQTQLGQLASLDRSTLGEMVGRLVARGLITRRRDPADNRRNTLELSAAGKRAFAAAVDPVADVNRRLVANLTEGERADLLALLHRLVSSGN